KNIQKNQNIFRLKTLFEGDLSKISPELWALLDYGRLLDLAKDTFYDYSYEPTARFGMFGVWKKYLRRQRQTRDSVSTITEEGGGFIEEVEEEADAHIVGLIIVMF
ncbi:hypothetical protein IFR05_017249, partial [Cadophora sp. M221]